MKISSKIVTLDGNNNIILAEVPLESIFITFPCILSIDGSTDRTGVGILRESDGAVCASLAFEKKDETAVAYKVRLKRAIQGLLERNRCITRVFYEEPFIEYAAAAAKLFMLRTFIEEIKVENEPFFDYLTYKEINNKRWKKLFLHPQVCTGDSKLHKKLVRDKLIAQLPFLKDVSQDEIDAIAMGFVAVSKMKSGEEDELGSKKKTRPFKYEVEFIGANEDDVAIQEMFDTCSIPAQVLENGITICNLPARGVFDNKIYEIMGQDDKLLIMKFSSNKHGDIILKHKLGYLASDFDYIYAIVWRKTRKIGG